MEPTIFLKIPDHIAAGDPGWQADDLGPVGLKSRAFQSVRKIGSAKSDIGALFFSERVGEYSAECV